MATCALLGKLGRRLQRIHGRPQLPFGGVNMIFLGDFYQFPPPTKYSSALYDANAAKSSKKQTAYGRLLWTGLTHCVILYEQMRIVNDAWAQMLERSRYAACTEADRELILARRISETNPVIWTDETRIVVGRNPLRTLLNFSAAESAAAGNRTVALVAVAVDMRSKMGVMPSRRWRTMCVTRPWTCPITRRPIFLANSLSFWECLACCGRISTCWLVCPTAPAASWLASC